MKVLRHSLIILLLASLVLVACGDDDEDGDAESQVVTNTDYKLGLVTNVGGSVDDGGFSESAHEGAERAVAEFGLDYAYAISKDSNDYAIQINSQIADNRNIIVTVGYQMEAVTLEYATENDDVYFIGVDQTYSDVEELPANIIGLQFAEDEAAFIVGALAGKMTTSNMVGVIGGMEIPPVIRLAEGFRNGAQYVNPDVTVLIEYTGSFEDGELGVQTAQDFIDEGADVVFGAAGITGYAGIQYAAREGAWVVGVDQDEWRTNFREGEIEGSERVLTSALKGVESGVYQAIDSIVAGELQAGRIVLDSAQCGVGYAPFHEAEAAVPEETQALLVQIWRALAAGTLETGVGSDMPEPLAPGASPEVPDDAPMPSDCEG